MGDSGFSDKQAAALTQRTLASKPLPKNSPANAKALALEDLADFDPCRLQGLQFGFQISNPAQ